MLFNSFVFLVFFLVFFSGWSWVRGGDNRRWAYIILFSLFFYGWWDWRYIFLLVATGLIDFYAGLGIYNRPRYARSILWISLGSNLFVLCFFKYSFFIAETTNVAFTFFGSGLRLPLISIILPVGISFYTFQSMSYTIDIYRKELKPTKNILHFFAAISLFPHLVAGPIMRASKLLPQLLQDRAATKEERWEGLRLVAHGFFKKVVIADNLAASVNDAFAGQMASQSSLAWWVIITMFAVQIYCDFSGYSDIARGLAKWMGYDFSLNFAHPYTAKSLRDFWSRWHISLSTWFRDYVYIPLGGSRRSELRNHLNIGITMVLSGLWHGAGWTYIMWGVLHSAFLSFERFTRWPERIKLIPLGWLFGWVLVILQVWVAWVFFRAQSFQQAMDILAVMFCFKGGAFAVSGTAMVFLAVGVIHEWYNWKNVERYKIATSWRASEAIVLIFVLVACVFFRGPGNTFIYFQF